jgi:hypothetical protein
MSMGNCFSTETIPLGNSVGKSYATSFHIDLTGQKFGRLYVVGPADEPIDDRPCWRVLCECGKYHTVRGRSLRRGDTRSCGCLRVEHAIATQPAASAARWERSSS